MQTPSFSKQYPLLNLQTLQASTSNDGFRAPILLTQPLPDKPTPQSFPRQSSLKKSTTSASKINPPGSSQKALRRMITRDNTKLEILKTTKAFHSSFKALDRVREIRTASETKLQRNMEKLEEQSRRGKNEQEAQKPRSYLDERREETFKLKGRAFDKERFFPMMRRMLEDIRYEMNNSSKVIKYPLTEGELDHTSLAKPRFTPKEIKKPQYVRANPKDIEQLGRMNGDLMKAFSQLQLESIEVPGMVEDEMLFSYNKGQLKKLKGGLSFINRVAARKKAKTPGLILEGRDQSEEYDHMSKEDRLVENFTQFYHDLSQTVQGDQNTGSKFYSKRQKIEDRMKSQGSKKELLKRLVGMAPQTEFAPQAQGDQEQQQQRMMRSSFFLTNADGFSRPDSPIKTEVLSSKFPKELMDRRSTATDHAERQSVSSPFFLPSNFSPVRNPSLADTSASILKGPGKEGEERQGGRFIRLEATAKKFGSKPVQARYRSFVMKETNGFNKSRTSIQQVNNDEVKTKYKMLQTECEHNFKSRSDLHNFLQSGFEPLRDQFDRLGEIATNKSYEVDWQIKKDILYEMQNMRENPPGKQTRASKMKQVRNVKKK